jgi:parallel beta-helix repeat protein
MAKPGGTVVIDATSAIDILLDLTYATSSYIIIDGFILDATNAAYGLWIEHAHHVRIKNSEVKNAKNVGIALYGAPGSQYVELLNLNVHGNGFTPSNPQIPGHGVYCTSHDNIIDGGSYHGNHGHGVHVYLSPSVGKGAPDRNIVRNIRAYGNGGPGVGIYFGKGNQVYNNLIYNNGGGLRVSAYNTLVANNTVYGNGPYYGILIDKPGNTVKNNIAYQNASGNIDSQVANTLSNNLTTDPNFVNAAAGDFRLQAGSPAINAGVTIREVTTDFDKRPRPQGTNFDLGAYEYTDGPGIARPRPRMNKR